MAESSQRLLLKFASMVDVRDLRERRGGAGTSCNAAEDTNIAVEGDTKEEQFRLRAGDANGAKPVEICIC